MIPEIGTFTLIVALLVAIVQCVLPMIGAATRYSPWMKVAVLTARTQFVLIATAFFCLAYSFIRNDFSVLNVAANSNSQLPIAYRFAATWGSHEGSLLLWTLILSLWTFAVTLYRRHVPAETLARVISVMGVISVGFLLFMLFTSNPFVRLSRVPAEGRDLNPLLQDPAMVAHPPILYMGYVGFSVVFAFAIAALISGELNIEWARWSRPWTLAAWTFLTCGIALGSYWAYYELGWGGWWFWDPVENASFMPWLAGTALIHSLVVTEKRGAFKSWTVLLAITAFSLSLLGTFLVRSGVLTSVHAFASDPKRGIFVLCFLAVVVGGSLLLYAWRARHIGLGAGFAAVSRESMLLTNNVLFAVAAGSVLLGTVYPLIIDALGAGKLSVGPPYFNTVFTALMVPAVFLLGIGPAARWRKENLPRLVIRLRWAFATSVLCSIVVPLVYGQWSAITMLGISLASWIMLTVAMDVASRLRHRLFRRRYWGMQLAHLGVAVFIIGVTMVTVYQDEKDVRLGTRETVRVGGYEFRFNGVQDVTGPNYVAARAEIEVLRDARLIRRMYPEKRSYNSSPNPITETAIDAGLFRDLYLSLGDAVDNTGAWSVRVHYKPFVDWIWAGAMLMAAGGAVALTDRRSKQER